MQILEHIPVQVIANWSQLEIDRLYPMPPVYWALVDVTPSPVDGQLLVEALDGFPRTDVLVDFVHGGKNVSRMPRLSFYSHNVFRAVGYRPTGTQVPTLRGAAEFSGQCEALYIHDPHIPSDVLRNVYFSAHPDVYRSQPHHNLVVRFALCANGEPLPVLTGRLLAKLIE